MRRSRRLMRNPLGRAVSSLVWLSVSMAQCTRHAHVSRSPARLPTSRGRQRACPPRRVAGPACPDRVRLILASAHLDAAPAQHAPIAFVLSTRCRSRTTWKRRSTCAYWSPSWSPTASATPGCRRRTRSRSTCGWPPATCGWRLAITAPAFHRRRYVTSLPGRPAAGSSWSMRSQTGGGRTATTAAPARRGARAPGTWPPGAWTPGMPQPVAGAVRPVSPCRQPSPRCLSRRNYISVIMPAQAMMPGRHAVGSPLGGPPATRRAGRQPPGAGSRGRPRMRSPMMFRESRRSRRRPAPARRCRRRGRRRRRRPHGCPPARRPRTAGPLRRPR